MIALGLALAIPYVGVAGLAPLFGASLEAQTVLLRRIYPFLLMAAAIIYLVQWQIFKFIRLYEHIKNDKYLVGKRLVNYDPKRNIAKQSSIDYVKQITAGGAVGPGHQPPPPGPPAVPAPHNQPNQ